MSFIGYPKDNKGFTFYSPEDDKTFVSTNARFLKEDVMKDVNPRSKIVLEEKLGEEALCSISCASHVVNGAHKKSYSFYFCTFDVIKSHEDSCL